MFRVTCNIPDVDERMLQFVCRSCFHGLVTDLREMGATKIIIADEINEQRILAALANAAAKR